MAGLLIIAFLVLVVLLGLNMLIAMMTATYERVRTQIGKYYLFLFARICLQWSHAPLVPPPLMVLSLPYRLFRLLLTTSRCCTKASGASRPPAKSTCATAAHRKSGGDPQAMRRSFACHLADLSGKPASIALADGRCEDSKGNSDDAVIATAALTRIGELEGKIDQVRAEVASAIDGLSQQIAQLCEGMRGAQPQPPARSPVPHQVNPCSAAPRARPASLPQLPQLPLTATKSATSPMRFRQGVTQVQVTTHL